MHKFVYGILLGKEKKNQFPNRQKIFCCALCFFRCCCAGLWGRLWIAERNFNLIYARTNTRHFSFGCLGSSFVHIFDIFICQLWSSSRQHRTQDIRHGSVPGWMCACVLVCSCVISLSQNDLTVESNRQLNCVRASVNLKNVMHFMLFNRTEWDGCWVKPAANRWDLYLVDRQQVEIFQLPL